MSLRLLLVVALLLVTGCSPAPRPEGSPSGPVLELPPSRGLQPDPRSVQAAEAARAGRTQEALETARRFTREEPGNPEAWAVLAAVQQATGRLQEAGESAARAAELDPRYEALLVQARMRGDAVQALEAARALAAREPANAASHHALAEAILYHAAAADLDGRHDPEALRRAALEARQEAERALLKAGRSHLRAEVLATMGSAWFLEGDLEKAAERYREALGTRPGLPPERAVEVAQTLAWLAFLNGNQEECARWLHTALDRLARAPRNAGALIPRWEYLHMQLWAFAGENLDRRRLESREKLYEQLRKMGMVDHFEYRTTRDMLRQVARLREEGHQHEAIKVLYDDPFGDDLERVEQGGELRPRSFMSEAVERDQEETLFHVIRAELAREARDWNAAHHWYEEALRLVPGNRILQERVSSLP